MSDLKKTLLKLAAETLQNQSDENIQVEPEEHSLLGSIYDTATDPVLLAMLGLVGGGYAGYKLSSKPTDEAGRSSQRANALTGALTGAAVGGGAGMLLKRPSAIIDIYEDQRVRGGRAMQQQEKLDFYNNLVPGYEAWRNLKMRGVKGARKEESEMLKGN